MRGPAAQFEEFGGEELAQDCAVRGYNLVNGLHIGGLLRSNLRERSAKSAERANRFAKMGEQSAELAE